MARPLCRILLFFAGVAIALGYGAHAFGEAGPLLVDRVSGCQLRLGTALPGNTAHWTGPCRNGLADGLGLLRVYGRRDGAAAISATFYGEMVAGSIVFGVVDTGEGYLAGRFEDGRFQDSDDFNTRLRAFRTASSAARAASARFAQDGNANSAAYYRRMAARLDMQIE